MNYDDYENKFFALLKATSELYGKSYSGAVYELWFNDIKRFNYEAVKRAFAIHRQNPDNGQFMPKPGDIVKIIEGSQKDNAYVAWTKVRNAILSAGAYQSICFDDPLIHLVIKDIGGWIQLCQKPEDELKFISNEFRKRYEGYKSKGEIPKYTNKLVGLHEAENTQENLIDHIPDPVLVGNKDMATKVLTGNIRLQIGI